MTCVCDQVGLFAGGSISERDLPPQELLRAIEAQHSLLSLLEEQWALTAAGAMHLADAAMMIFRRMLEVESPMSCLASLRTPLASGSAGLSEFRPVSAFPSAELPPSRFKSAPAPDLHLWLLSADDPRTQLLPHEEQDAGAQGR